MNAATLENIRAQRALQDAELSLVEEKPTPSVSTEEMVRRLTLASALVGAALAGPALWIASREKEGTEKTVLRTLAIGLVVLDGYLLWKILERR